MSHASAEIGSTRSFVLAKGFRQVGTYAALIGEDDTRRLFAEVYADPDRPDVRPKEAYRAILSSIQPGWTLRLLQLFWPDPEPRLEFQKQVQRWNTPATEGLDILHQGLALAVQEYPLPFVRRTVLEFVLPGDEGKALPALLPQAQVSGGEWVAWWERLGGLCAGFGLRIQYLDQAAIESLTRWVLNLNLEYRM